MYRLSAHPPPESSPQHICHGPKALGLLHNITLTPLFSAGQSDHCLRRRPTDGHYPQCLITTWTLAKSGVTKGPFLISTKAKDIIAFVLFGLFSSSPEFELSPWRPQGKEQPANSLSSFVGRVRSWDFKWQCWYWESQGNIAITGMGIL